MECHRGILVGWETQHQKHANTQSNHLVNEYEKSTEVATTTAKTCLRYVQELKKEEKEYFGRKIIAVYIIEVKVTRRERERER